MTNHSSWDVLGLLTVLLVTIYVTHLNKTFHGKTHRIMKTFLLHLTVTLLISQLKCYHHPIIQRPFTKSIIASLHGIKLSAVGTAIVHLIKEQLFLYCAIGLSNVRICVKSMYVNLTWLPVSLAPASLSKFLECLCPIPTRQDSFLLWLSETPQHTIGTYIKSANLFNLYPL